MASLDLTGAVPGANPNFFSGIAGATVTQGAIVYLGSNGKIQEAQANSATTASILGVAVNGGTINSPIMVQTSGYIVTSGLTAGTIYVLSDSAAGQVMLVSDLTTGDRLSIVGIAISATSLLLGIVNSGTTAA